MVSLFRAFLSQLRSLFCHEPAATEAYTLSLHDALPILGLIVAQQDIVRRAIGLNQVVFKNQRFGFIAGNGDLYLMNSRYQGRCLGAQAGFSKIAGQPLFQVLGFTHVKKLARAIKHLIDAGLGGGVSQKASSVKGLGNGNFVDHGGYCTPCSVSAHRRINRPERRYRPLAHRRYTTASGSRKSCLTARRVSSTSLLISSFSKIRYR